MRITIYFVAIILWYSNPAYPQYAIESTNQMQQYCVNGTSEGSIQNLNVVSENCNTNYLASPISQQIETDYLKMHEYFEQWKTDAWQHVNNEFFVYDNNNNCYQSVSLLSDGRGPRRKTDYFYDGSNNLTEEREFQFSDSVWIPYRKCIYYAENNMKQKTYLYWKNNKYENDSQYTYLYNENNEVYYSTIKMWDYTESTWLKGNRFNYLFDENGNKYGVLNEVWDSESNAWVNGSKSWFFYDKNNNLISISSWKWDLETLSWDRNSTRQLYAYDEDNNRIFFVFQSWSKYTSEWINDFRYTYYYLPKNSETNEYKRKGLKKTIEDIQTTTDDLTVIVEKNALQNTYLIGVEVLIDTVRHTSVGDLVFTLSHNNITDTLINHAGADGHDVIGIILTDRGIDTISKGIPPFFGNYKPENPLSKFLGTDPAGTWTLGIYDGVAGNTGELRAWGINLIYHTSTSIVEELHSNFLFKVYPNPAEDKIKVQSLQLKTEGATIEIYDLNARKLLEKQIPTGTKNVELDISHLQSGVYLCRLISKNKSVTQKLIIQ